MKMKIRKGRIVNKEISAKIWELLRVQMSRKMLCEEGTFVVNTGLHQMTTGWALIQRARSTVQEPFLSSKERLFKNSININGLQI